MGAHRRCWGTASSLAQPVCWWPCPATRSLSSSASGVPTSRPTSCWLRVIAGRLGRVCSVHLSQCYPSVTSGSVLLTCLSVLFRQLGHGCSVHLSQCSHRQRPPKLTPDQPFPTGRSRLFCSVLFTCLSVLPPVRGLPTSHPTSCWLRTIAGRSRSIYSVHLIQCSDPSETSQAPIAGRPRSILFTCLSVLIR